MTAGDPPSERLPQEVPEVVDLAGELAGLVRHAARRMPQQTQPATVYRLAEPQNRGE